MDNCHLHRHVVLIIESNANVSCVQINSYHLNRKSRHHHLLLEVVQLAVLLAPVLEDVVAYWLLVLQGLLHHRPKVQLVVDVAAVEDQALSKSDFGASNISSLAQEHIAILTVNNSKTHYFYSSFFGNLECSR